MWWQSKLTLARAGHQPCYRRRRYGLLGPHASGEDRSAGILTVHSNPRARRKDDQGETNPPGGHSRERWAAAVARDMLKPHPSLFIRRDFLAWTMMMASLLFPVRLFDWVFTKASKLGELKSIFQSEIVKKTS
jgi:hypothetical protein